MISSSRNNAAVCCAVIAALSSAAWLAHGQGGPLGGDRAIPPTPFLVGAGARAAGMANAFTAVADDATAASWNPAGLVQLERPELSLVGAMEWMEDSFSSWREPEIDGTHAYSTGSLNFASAVYPVRRQIAGRNLVLSLSYQRKYDFVRRFDASLNSLTGGPGGIVLGQRSSLDVDQSGSLGAVSPAFAFELTNTLSVGAALNLWRDTGLDDGGWEQTTRVRSAFNAGGALSFLNGRSREEYEDFQGENVTLGVIWNAAPRWSLGVRYDSAFTGTARYRSWDRGVRFVPGNPLMPVVINGMQTRERREIHFPDSLSLGVAYRRNDRLTLAFDISRTDWNDLYLKTGDGTKFSLVDGVSRSNPLQQTDLDPTYAVRFGMEYVLIPKQPGTYLNQLWSLRGGLAYEEEPASGRDSPRFFAPGDGRADRFYGASVGVGVLVRQRFNIDLAYQARIGADVNGDLNPGAAEFEADEVRHRLMFSTVIYF